MLNAKIVPSPEEWLLVRTLWPLVPGREISERTGYSEHVIRRMSREMKLPPRDYGKRSDPDPESWLRIAREEAVKSSLAPHHVVGHCKLRPVVKARWRALVRFGDENPNSSVAGLARSVGMDHSSILHMRKRIAAEAQGTMPGKKPKGIAPDVERGRSAAT